VNREIISGLRKGNDFLTLSFLLGFALNVNLYKYTIYPQHDNTQNDKSLKNVGPILNEMHTYLCLALFNIN